MVTDGQAQLQMHNRDNGWCLLSSGCQGWFLWVYWPGLLPITTSWQPRCWYLTRWCHPWKDWKPAEGKPVSKTSLPVQVRDSSILVGVSRAKPMFLLAYISSSVIRECVSNVILPKYPPKNSRFWSQFCLILLLPVKETLSSPCSWQWGHKWWRCLCHVSPASSGLPPPGSPRSGPPPYWNWWATSSPSPARPPQGRQTRRASRSVPRWGAEGHLGCWKGRGWMGGGSEGVEWTGLLFFFLAPAEPSDDNIWCWLGRKCSAHAAAYPSAQEEEIKASNHMMAWEPTNWIQFIQLLLLLYWITCSLSKNI